MLSTNDSQPGIVRMETGSERAGRAKELAVIKWSQ